MADPTRGLTHQDADKKTDELLRQEARGHLSKSGPVQLAAELLLKLRELSPAWWKPAHLRAWWPAADRMRWLEQRTDLRQHITTSLTGLAPKAAKKKAPDFQAALIDAVIDEGDIAVERFEEAFDACDLAIYGPVAEIWRKFRERMPWDEETQANMDLTAWLLRVLLTDKSAIEGCARRPVLSAWDVRTAIDGKTWHMRMPLDVRVAIDEARLQQERATPGQPFHAHHELAIAVPELIAANVPLKELAQMLDRAEKALGLEPPPPPSPRPSASSVRPEAPRGSALDASKPGVVVTDGAAPKLSALDAKSAALDAARPVPEPSKSEPGRPSVRPEVVKALHGQPSPGARASETPSRPGGVPPGDASPKGGEVPAGAARTGSLRPSAAPTSSVSPPRPSSEFPRTASPSVPPSALPRDMMPATALIEDDDLEKTNPWMVPDDAELLIDHETTSNRDARSPPDASSFEALPPPRKRGRPGK